MRVSEPIHDYGTDAAGNKIDRGIFCIDPSGHLIVVPPNQPIKAGWRLATHDEPAKSEPAIEVIGEPVEAFVESISIDAPSADDVD